MPTDVFFATNRTQPTRKGGAFGNRFHREGPQFFEVGHATVTWKDPDPGTRDWDAFDIAYELQAGRRPAVETLDPREVPETHRKQARNERTGSARMFQRLRQEMQETNRDILVFLHGFANSFENSIARAAQLKEAYTILPPAGEPAYEPFTFAFCWPSDGKVQPPWKYTSDRDDAALSGIAMARALRRLVDFLEADERCDCRLHLVAHSMGNWALRHAILGLRALLDERRLPRLFENAFLMAADEDDDCFESIGKMASLTDLANSIQVYHSRDDLALKISDSTKGNVDRLGANGPKSFSGISSRITAIDCRKVDNTEPQHGRHQYYRLRKEVIADVRHVLSGRYPPDQIPDREKVEPGRRYRIEA